MQTTVVTTTAFIVRGDTTLIAKRAETDDYLPGYWEQVGGKLDWGEAPADGMIREVKEESGLEVQPVKVYAAYNHINEEKERHIVEIAYICRVVGADTVTISAEHSEYKWIIEEELSSIEPMSDYMREVIREGFKQKI